MTDLRLLGPVELRGAGGSRYELGSPKQRCVLAVLAMSPGRPVAVETLIRYVWYNEPGEVVRDVLYSYVSRLRRVLRQAGDDGPPAPVLRRDNGGYLLDIAPENVDLHRARGLARRAQTEQQQSADAARAAQLLGEAAAQWRGLPLAGLRGQWAERVRAGLQDELVTLLTERYALELLQGRHAQAVAALSADVTEHPLAQPLTGQLMLALYRSGRQTDALQAYARIREQLVEEIGEEPGPTLRRLHERILRQDPGLDLRPATPDPAAAGREQGDEPCRAPRALHSEALGSTSPLAVRPAQLPPDIAGFTGRKAGLERLDRLRPEAAGCPDGAAICVIVGTAGVGKTTLAVHWAQRAVEHFPGGQLYVNLRGFATSDSPTEPAEALRGFLQALGVPDDQIPEGTDARSGLFRSLLAGRRMLVVLDNARDADQVRPLLPGAPGCTTVITSRSQLPELIVGTGADQLILQPLTPDEARQLLARRLGADRVEDQQQAVTEIISGCVRLPLALALIAAHAATRPGLTLKALADRDPDAGGYHLAADVRTVFSWSYRILSPAAARLFRLVGLHPGPEFSTGAAASLVGLARPRARTLLGELTKASLLTESSPGRFTVHDLLRDYAAELAREHDTERGRQAAVHRVLDYYLHSAHAAWRALWAHRDRLQDPGARSPDVTPEDLTVPAQAQDWYGTERRTLTEAVHLAASTGLDTHAVRLGRRLAYYLDREGRWHEQDRLLAIVVTAAQRTADYNDLARAHCDHARAGFRLGRVEPALERLHAAHELFCKAGDGPGQADVHHFLVNLHETQGNLGEALHHARQALALYRVADDRRGEGRELNAIGWIYGLFGQPQLTLDHCRKALVVQESVGDRYFMGITWDSLGRAHHRLGDPHEAIACFRRALELLESPEASDRLNAAKAYTALGDAQHSIGAAAMARSSWKQALRILEELRHPAAAEALTRLQNA